MTAPVTPVMPDVELVVVEYLRRVGSRVLDLVAVDSNGNPAVYTTIPNRAEAEGWFPLLRVYRIGGGPVRSVPLHLEAAAIQLDAYGGSKADARRLLDTARAELADANEHTHTGAVITGVTFGAVRYLPESGMTPARPRYTGDITVIIHP